mmetsp:Transcript_7350/g.7925  ORF Transcript_7350/g.7925 Transcript_7350/m.7925 type:complete len:403 (+) Transcript_7350:86-1294(+)
MTSTSLYLKFGKIFKVTDKEELDIHECLPTATYTIGFNSCSGEYYLEKIEPFSIPKKLYGNPERRGDRILQTFHDRKGSTGVVLSGEKGSGKTLLAKYISKVAAERDGIITLVINEPWCGETFNQFLQMIQQPAVVIFDEFEKVYNCYEKKKQMLTLLDGVYSTQKLFILTCNDKWSLDVNMRNRPGRIFYMIDYNGLDIAFIQDYCEENLSAKEHIPQIVAISKVFMAFNFDMLKAMVEEMNRYNESPMDVLELLNVQPHYESDTCYTYRMFDKDEDPIEVDHNGFDGNPLKDPIRVYYTSKKNKYKKTEFSPHDLVQVDEKSGAFVFVNARGFRVVLKRNKINAALTLKSLNVSMQKKKDEGILSNGITRMLLEDESTDESSTESYDDDDDDNDHEYEED